MFTNGKSSITVGLCVALAVVFAKTTEGGSLSTPARSPTALAPDPEPHYTGEPTQVAPACTPHVKFCHSGPDEGLPCTTDAECGGSDCRDDCWGAWSGADCVVHDEATGAGKCYIPKNRYLSIDPIVNGTIPVAFRVEITELDAQYDQAGVGWAWWLDEPQCYDYQNGEVVVPAPTSCEGSDRFGWVSELTSTPVTRVWTEVPVHITGCGIAPAVTYEIRASTDEGGSLSVDSLEVGTARNPGDETQSWGDLTGGPVPDLPGSWLPPEGTTNMADIGNAIRTFENRSEDTGFPPLLWVDVEIDRVVSLGDIQFLIMAFEGAAYASINLPLIGADPVNCPEAAPPLIKEPPNGQPGNPMRTVYLFSGEFYERVVDLRIKGRGFDFVWARKYRSRIGPDTEMGHGWDYSYNRRIEQAGEHIRLFDGNTRNDVYYLRGDGTWTRREFFRVLEKNPDDTYTLTFANKLKWNFHSLDGSAVAGQIASIVDRTGNTMTFDYDGSGRLIHIHDTLDGEPPMADRVIEVAYNAAGLIESVTELWTGRSVTYAYYDGVEGGGNLGDLKSVTSPAVMGTPNGNDFEFGKTTTYTYSAGFADERLNHNLLTITDPLGQTFLTNIYATTLDPNDVEFDHVVTQIWGDPGDRLDAVYVPLEPTPDNHFAVVMGIVNDRVGNVEELLYDGYHRCVMRREYTGRAPNPDAPTTPTTNEPELPLRPEDDDPPWQEDPPFFVTVYTYNEDALVTQIGYPNGNSVEYDYEVDLDPAAPWRSRGNLRQMRRYPGPLGGDQTSIVEDWEYDNIISNDHNFVTRHEDGRREVTSYEYDTVGNLTRTVHPLSIVEDWEYYIGHGQVTAHIWPDNGDAHRRRDVFTYYNEESDGYQYGYLKEKKVDVGGFELTTSYTYDAVGNITGVTDPKGEETLFQVNQLDQVVRRTSRAVELPPDSGNFFSYTRDVYYDANDNIVRVDIENMDDQGPTEPPTYFSTIHEYDILKYRIRTCQEVSEYLGTIATPPDELLCADLPESDFITTAYEFDENRNRTLVRYGDATSGGDPDNEVQYVYDERNLLFRQIRAPGVSPPDGEPSTVRFDYDANGNLALQGVEETSDDRITIYKYDGYDRIWGRDDGSLDDAASVDPMGNETFYHYDANGNLTSQRLEGELVDFLGGAYNVRLSEVAYEYDELNRLTRTVRAFFDPATTRQTPLSDGDSTTTIDYSGNSQVVSVTDARGHVTTTDYDTANRARKVTDAAGNELTYTYDDNSNIETITTVEKSDVAGHDDQSFTTTYAYDALGRRTLTTDNVGNTTEYRYDSRGNRTVTIDARLHETRYAYDGVNRLTATIRDMEGEADIVTTQEWDDSHRLTARTDDNGNVTAYAYDALNRLTHTDYADCTSATRVYDVHDNLTASTDANGTDIDYSYDRANRLTLKSITPGDDVSAATTFEDLSYDGRSLVVRAENNEAVVTFEWDSLANCTSEMLKGRTTQRTFDGVGNKLSCTYPGVSGRTIDIWYDVLDNAETISDSSGTIATFRHIGPRRLERIEYGNGTRLDLAWNGVANDPDDYGLKRIRQTTHRLPDEMPFDDRKYTWDEAQNKTSRENLLNGVQHDHEYDFINRLTATIAPGVSISYTLDGVGNRDFVEIIGGGQDAGDYDMVASPPPLCEPADDEMNQYTSTPFDGRQYDQNGNLVDIDQVLPDPRNLELVYDYANRLVAYHDYTTGVDVSYKYDCFGRRIEKSVDSPLRATTITRSFYDGGLVIMEQDGVGTTTAEYVWLTPRQAGIMIDDQETSLTDVLAALLTMSRGGVDYYYHCNDLGSVIALTDGIGEVVERYAYRDYGQTLIFDAQDQLIPESAVGNPYTYKSMRLDDESGLLYSERSSPPPPPGSEVQTHLIDFPVDSPELGIPRYKTMPIEDRLDGPPEPDYEGAEIVAEAAELQEMPQESAENWIDKHTRSRPQRRAAHSARYLDPRAGRYLTRDTTAIWGDLHVTDLGNPYTAFANNPWSVSADGLRAAGASRHTGRLHSRGTIPVPAIAASNTFAECWRLLQEIKRLRKRLKVADTVEEIVKIATALLHAETRWANLGCDEYFSPTSPVHAQAGYQYPHLSGAGFRSPCPGQRACYYPHIGPKYGDITLAKLTVLLGKLSVDNLDWEDPEGEDDSPGPRQ